MREHQTKCAACGYYTKHILKFLISHIGLVSLVVGYTIIGAFTFESLEAEHELVVKKNMSAVRLQVTDSLWEMTDQLPFLNETLWSDKARDHLKMFERSLIRAIKNDGWDGSEDLKQQQWTFAGALFYSIILITTIGYGHIAPKTSWGKVVTIFYAIPGVPLMMLCLANIGDGMAHSFRFLYWKVCCYVCTRKPKRKRRGRSRRRYHGSTHRRGGSFRQSGRASQRSADSQYSDSAFFSRASYYSDPESRMYDDMVDEGMRGLSQKAKGGNNHQQPHIAANARASQLSKDSAEGIVHYALEKENLDSTPDYPSLEDPVMMNKEHPKEKDKRSGKERKTEKETDKEASKMDSFSKPSNLLYPESPPLSRSPSRYARHLQPPDAGRGKLSRQEEEEYYYEEYYDDYEDSDEEEERQRPVPIWLGVMLVVAYIFGGAFLFHNWEQWKFLDSVYFCFITLTTIGFGDFVPAQKVKENVEVSIALCSLYLLFGIALLAMSFNLVQEEVINNVKNVAKRLGIIKSEEDEEDED